MADGSTSISTTLKGKVSEAEWKARVDLAALYRLVAVHVGAGDPQGRTHSGQASQPRARPRSRRTVLFHGPP